MLKSLAIDYVFLIFKAAFLFCRCHIGFMALWDLIGCLVDFEGALDSEGNLTIYESFSQINETPYEVY